MDAVHSSRPILGRELPHVSLPDFESGKPSLASSLTQHLAAVGIPLDRAHGRVAQYQVSQQAATGSGEQM
jgi:hypothetical protein